MRTPNFATGQRLAGFFRLCLCLLIALTLATGGMALNTESVQAVWMSINPPNLTDNNLVECQYWEYLFTHDCSDSDTPNCCTVTPWKTYNWWVTGVMPPGLTLDQNGKLSGYPDVASAGNYIFTIRCTEVGCCWWPPGTCGPNFAAANVNLTVNQFDPTLCLTQIDPVFYPVAWENMLFTMTLTATGVGVGPFNWTVTGLPPGVTVTNAANGIIGGAPLPGTCGIWNVTATVTDTGACCPAGNCCCCLPISRPFVLIVDCWANYASYFAPGTHTDSFTVRMGPNLTQGQANVLIDGIQKTKLGANQSQTFSTKSDELHLVTVDQTVVPGTDPNTMFEVKGANQIVVGGTVTEAYFDYAQKVRIKTGSDPTGVSEPPGTGFHTIGGTFTTTAPSPVQPQEGIKYIFKEFRLPDGSTSHNRDLWFTVNKAGDVTAVYDIYYLLHLTSDYPPVDDKSYHLAGSNAEYNLALPTVPMGGILGGLGGALRPVNTSGTIPMTGPRTEEILWKTDLTWPIIFIVLILLVIGGLCYFLYRLKSAPTRKEKEPAPKPKSKRQRTTKTTVKSKQQDTKKTGGSRTTGRKAR